MIFDPCYKYCFLFYFLTIGGAKIGNIYFVCETFIMFVTRTDFDQDCLKDNIDYGPDSVEIFDVDSVLECVKICQSYLGCAAFSFAKEIGCSLYTKNRMAERSTSNKIKSGILAECVSDLEKVEDEENKEFGSDYDYIKEFQPMCAKHRGRYLIKCIGNVVIKEISPQMIHLASREG